MYQEDGAPSRGNWMAENKHLVGAGNFKMLFTVLVLKWLKTQKSPPPMLSIIPWSLQSAVTIVKKT